VYVEHATKLFGFDVQARLLFFSNKSCISNINGDKKIDYFCMNFDYSKKLFTKKKMSYDGAADLSKKNPKKLQIDMPNVVGFAWSRKQCCCICFSFKFRWIELRDEAKHTILMTKNINWKVLQKIKQKSAFNTNKQTNIEANKQANKQQYQDFIVLFFTDDCTIFYSFLL